MTECEGYRSKTRFGSIAVRRAKREKRRESGRVLLRPHNGASAKAGGDHAIPHDLRGGTTLNLRKYN